MAVASADTAEEAFLAAEFYAWRVQLAGQLRQVVERYRL